MANITSEQGDRIISLLEALLEASRTNAVQCAQVVAELARPRLEKERFDAAIRESNAVAESERQVRQVEREAKERDLHSARSRCFAGQGGIPVMRNVLPPEEEGGPP